MKKATFINSIFQGSYKSLFTATIGDVFIIEKETKNSVYLTSKNGVSKWIQKYNVTID
jgi:hypothetical protein